MNAGETRDLWVEMDFEMRPEMSHDISVVAWGDRGVVRLQHKDGIPSDHFPTL